MQDILREIRRSISGHRMLDVGARVIVGVSGGPDSMALLHALCRIAPEMGLTLHAVHINHNLRGHAAQDDASEVERFCRGLGVPVAVVSVDVRALAKASGSSLEMAGRAARYRSFAEHADMVGAQRIAVGHNADDVVETVLLNLVRGAGNDGLAGIPPVRWVRPEPGGLAVVRPLIGVARGDIEAYCEQWKLSPRFDASNREDVYLRNRIRNRLLPLLESDYNPRVRGAIRRAAEVARGENDLVAGVAAQEYRSCAREVPGLVSVDGAHLQALHPALQRRVIRMALDNLGHPTSFERIEAARALAGGQGGSEVELGGGITGRLSRGRVVLRAAGLTPRSGCVDWAVRLAIPGSAALPGGRAMLAEVLESVPEVLVCQACTALLDADLVGDAITVRSRRPGDRFIPFGRHTLVKVKDSLIDAKIDPAERSVVPIVESSNGICWVGGVRADARFGIGPATRRVVRLSLMEFFGGQPYEY